MHCEFEHLLTMCAYGKPVVVAFRPYDPESILEFQVCLVR
jgi:hypothetical protein